VSADTGLAQGEIVRTVNARRVPRPADVHAAGFRGNARSSYAAFALTGTRVATGPGPLLWGETLPGPAAGDRARDAACRSLFPVLHWKRRVPEVGMVVDPFRIALEVFAHAFALFEHRNGGIREGFPLLSVLRELQPIYGDDVPPMVVEKNIQRSFTAPVWRRDWPNTWPARPPAPREKASDFLAAHNQQHDTAGERERSDDRWNEVALRGFHVQGADVDRPSPCLERDPRIGEHHDPQRDQHNTDDSS
jgi:hypothetical protein